MLKLTRQQAARFLLYHHGLLGEHRFSGKDGACDYVRQTGCIQFDPVDACGRNAELTLQSRIKGFSKQMLHELLYKDRRLVDYPDKQLAILPTEDWPYFERFREKSRVNGRRFSELSVLESKTKEYIAAHGPVSSDELPIEGKIRWNSAIHWSGDWHGTTKASRAVLEQLYSTGELVIHHKVGARKYYDLAEKHLPEALLTAPDPLPEAFDHQKWRVLRRIGAVGLLWNRNSDAFLGISDLTPEIRSAIFRQLEEEGKILPVEVEGIRGALYLRKEHLPALKHVLHTETLKPRCECIAPLDPLMWDRKLIRTVFGFEYSWEIYTPQEKRRYGYYVLPLIYGDRFVGRIEPVASNGVLTVKNLWLEDGVRPTKKLLSAVNSCMKRLAKLNGAALDDGQMCVHTAHSSP